MFLLAFSILDVWAGVYVLILCSGFVNYEVAFLHSAYLFVKGIWFWDDLYSFLDVLISIMILFFAIGFTSWILAIAASLYLLQKGLSGVGYFLR